MENCALYPRLECKICTISKNARQNAREMHEKTLVRMHVEMHKLLCKLHINLSIKLYANLNANISPFLHDILHGFRHNLHTNNLLSTNNKIYYYGTKKKPLYPTVHSRYFVVAEVSSTVRIGGWCVPLFALPTERAAHPWRLPYQRLGTAPLMEALEDTAMPCNHR